MQHLIVCTVLVGQRCDRMIGTDQHGAVHFLSIPFGQLIDILNRSAVPVFPKGHAVRLIASLIGGMCFLHVCQRLEQVIQSIEVRFAKLGIEIPRNSGHRRNRLRHIGCRSIGVHLGRDRPYAVSDTGIKLLNLLPVSHQVRIALDLCTHVCNKSYINTLQHIRIVQQDDISQITRCRSCLIERFAVAGYLRRDNVKNDVELVFQNLAIPSALQSLIIGRYVIHLKCKFLVVGNRRRFCRLCRSFFSFCRLTAIACRCFLLLRRSSV